MNPGLLLDITQIPDKLAGLAVVGKALAVVGLGFLVPFTILEMNVRSLNTKERASYSGFATRVLVAVMCLIAYRGLFTFILRLSQAMSFAMLSEEQWGNFLAESMKGSDSSYPTLAILYHSVTSLQQLLLFLSSLVAVLVRDVVVMLQACFLSLLYAFGPIALVCGVNEKTIQVTRGWLANTFQVAFWSFFLRLAVRVWLTLAPLSGSSGTGIGDDYIGILTINLTFLIMILGTPFLASRLLSGENLAAFGEAALAGVQTIVVTRQLKAGRLVSKEVEAYRRAEPQERRSFLHHPIPATMTRTYEMMFGKSGRKTSDPAKRGGA